MGMQGRKDMTAQESCADEFEDMEDEEWCDDEEDDIGLASTGGDNADDDFFDAVIGKLEEIIMGDAFNHHQKEFMEAHCQLFDRQTEMKLEFTQVFQEYTSLIEQHIESGLTEGVPGFDMARFLGLLEEREDEGSADVFEMFRDQMCEFKEQIVAPVTHTPIHSLSSLLTGE